MSSVTIGSTISYTYDDLGRLTAVNYGEQSIQYNYDPAGNIASVVVAGDTVAGTPVSADVLESFETGNLSGLPWQTSGDAAWDVTASLSHSGAYSARSPLGLTDAQSGSLQVSLDCTGDTISFWLSVSSEQDYDFLEFYIDGTLQEQWSGTVDWTEVSFPITAGTHTFLWRYSKDSSVSGGEDAAWIDDISLAVDETVSIVDSDLDGVADSSDAFPADGSEWVDSDSDGVGNNADLDDDGDGMPDDWEFAHGLNPLNAADAAADLDLDGLNNLAEYLAGSDPQDGAVDISGRVYDASGVPLAQVWVEAYAGSIDSWSGADTNADGFYVITVPPAADYRVTVWNTGQYQTMYYDHASKWEDASVVDLSAGAVVGVDFVLQAGVTIGGNFNGLDAGEVAQVEAWSESTQSWASVNVVGDGSGTDSFLVSGLATASDYRLSVWSDNYAGGYLMADGSLGGWDEAVAVVGSSSDVSITLTTACSVSGTLSGLLPGDAVWVTAWNDASGNGNSTQVVATASEESFTVSGLTPEAGYRVSVFAENYGGGFYGGSLGAEATVTSAWSEATLIDLSGGDQGGVNILLSSGMTISGSVSGLAEGSQAWITAWSESSGSWSGASITGSDSLVSYELMGLAAADDYRVSIYADGYLDGFYSTEGVANWDAASLVDVSSLSPDNINFVLGQGYSISGTISGLAVGEQAWVEVWSDDAWSWESVGVVGTDAPVTYVVSGLPAAEDYEVSFHPEAHASKVVNNVDSSVNPTNVNCIVEVGNSIIGTISGALPYEKITVHASSQEVEDRASVTVFADSLGSAVYEIADLSPAADYVVFAETDTKQVFYDGESSLLSATEVDLNSGDQNNVNFVLDLVSTYTVTGTLSGIADNGLVWIDAWDEQQGVWAGTSRLGDGVFSLTVPAGSSCRIGIYGEGIADSYYSSSGVLSSDISEATAVDTEVDLGLLTVSAGHGISGNVYLDINNDGSGQSDEKLAGVTVEISNSSVIRSVVSDSCGHYLLQSLPVGSYSLTVLSEYGSYVEVVTLDADLSDHNILLTTADVGALSGLVTDASGAGAANAVIAIFDSGNLFVNAIYANAAGNYQYQGLSSGSYTIKVDAGNDGNFEQTVSGVTITDGSNILNIALP